MQKFINVLAVASFVVSAGVVAGATYVYLSKDALVEQAKEEAMKEIQDLISGALSDKLFTSPGEGIDLPDPTRIDETGAQPIPVIPFSI